MTRKECGSCGLSLPLSSFAKDKSTTTGFTSYCKKCRNRKERSRTTRSVKAKHTEYLRAIKKKYNLNEEDLVTLLLEQQGECFICRKDLGELNHRYYIDHDHDTGLVRGLLCPRCNTGLSFYEEYLDNQDMINNYLLRGRA